ncbi:MAG: hypothetical protein QGF59_01400, partial [Pirellulaceae bacterium]|nr:hypothetical protein [Pirellulaceae bacterium]
DCSHSVFTDDNTPVVIVTRDEGIREAKQRISKLLELLSDDEQDVVRLRLGLDGVHGGRSYDEVCRETSRDGDAVRRDVAEACKKMRQTVRPQSKEDGSLASKFRVTPVRLAIVRAIIRSAGDWVRLHVIHKQCQEIMPFDRHTLYRDVALIEGLGEIEIHRPDRATTEVRWISIDPEVQLQAATKLYLMHLEGAAS